MADLRVLWKACAMKSANTAHFCGSPPQCHNSYVFKSEINIILSLKQNDCVLSDNKTFCLCQTKNEKVKMFLKLDGQYCLY